MPGSAADRWSTGVDGLRAYGFAVLAVATALLIITLTPPLLEHGNAQAVLLLAVFVCGLYCGTRAALTATVLAIFGLTLLQAGSGEWPLDILVLAATSALVVWPTTRFRAERARAETLRAQSEQAYLWAQQIIDSIPEGISVHAADGRLLMSNARFREIIGYAIPERTDEFFRLVRPRSPDGRAYSIADLPVTRALAGEAVHGEELLWSTASGDRVVLRGAHPLRAPDGRVTAAVALASDISDLRDLERMRLEMFALLGHEIKTPVATMLGQVDLARRWARVGDSDRLRDTLEHMRRQLERVGRLVAELMDISQIGSGRFELAVERVDIARMVREAVARHAPLARDHHFVLEGRIEDELGVTADEFRLEQVLDNLLMNAVKYSPDGGRVTVALSRSTDHAEIRVTDEGVGIPEADRAGLFAPFFRTRATKAIPGTGLGLYISRDIMRRSGGDLVLESPAPRPGSTFLVRIPIAP